MDYLKRNYLKAIENSTERMEKSGITENNKNTIKKFDNFCASAGLHPNTRSKYLCYLPKMAKILGKDFEKADRDDIIRLIAELGNTVVSERTVDDYRKMIKRFYKWLLGEDEYYPHQVRWIKGSFRGRKKILPEALLTEEEIKKLIEVAYYMRDKALISTLYEGGFRVGELRAMKIRHIEFENQYARITVPHEGKTGVRRVLGTKKTSVYVGLVVLYATIAGLIFGSI